MTAKRQYDFVGRRKLFMGFSGLLCLISAVLLIVPGPNYGIDFLGGSTVVVEFTEAVDPAEVRSAAEEMGLLGVSVQEFGAGDGTEYLIETRSVTTLTDERRDALTAAITTTFGADARLEADDTSGDKVYVRLPLAAYTYEPEGSGALPTPDQYQTNIERLGGEIAAAMQTAGVEDVEVAAWGNPADRRFAVRIQALQQLVADGLTERFADRFNGIERVETVGPRVGAQLRDDGIQAVVVALALVLLYIAFRFDLRYAPAAVIALGHDVLITLGVFVVLREEINLPMIAAVLTIVGYSLNDTIINFDRIRENLQGTEGKVDLWNLVNQSVNECLSRTMLTAGTTLMAVTVILIVGGGLIHTFALAMFLGVVVGTYSSVYISNPIMVYSAFYLDERKRVRDAAAAASRRPAAPSLP